MGGVTILLLTGYMPLIFPNGSEYFTNGSLMFPFKNYI